jgi:hypothetical protein
MFRAQWLVLLLRIHQALRSNLSLKNEDSGLNVSQVFVSSSRLIPGFYLKLCNDPHFPSTPFEIQYSLTIISFYTMYRADWCRVNLQTRILELLGSNLSWDTGYADSCSSCFSWVPHQTMITSVQIISNYSDIILFAPSGLSTDNNV